MHLAAVSEEALDMIGARAPHDVKVVPLDSDRALRAQFLVPRSGDRSTIESLEAMEELEVIQLLSAGTDWIEDRVPAGVTLCSARGARDAPVAEWVVAALLGASSGLLQSARERSWQPRLLEDLSEWTVVVVGMGSIGRAVEARLAPFGTSVIGVGRQARDGVRGIDELGELLGEADAVVILTPLTEETRGLISSAELRAMRDGTLLVNAARGAVVDTDALAEEVESGRLRAVLDVTDPEPLPEGHPLWRAVGTLSITPHIAGDSERGNQLAAELALRQLERWRAGEPLENVVQRPPLGGSDSA